MFADVMTPGLPIHRSTFFAGGNIGLPLPTNLLGIYGLNRGDSVASCSFGGIFQVTIFLVEGYLLFVFHFLVLFI
jgi:hypothetical protein